MITLGLQLIKIMLGVDPAERLRRRRSGRRRHRGGGRSAQPGRGLPARRGRAALSPGTRVGTFRRRPATLVVDAFGFALIMLALLYVAGLFAWPFVEIIRLITFAALGLAPVAFLFALLDIRLARGDVAGLLVELRADPTIGPAGPARPGAARFVVAAVVLVAGVRQLGRPGGKPAPVPTPDDRRAVRVLYREDEPMAALSFDRSLEDDLSSSTPYWRRPVSPWRTGGCEPTPGAASGAAGLADTGVRGQPAGTATART